MQDSSSQEIAVIESRRELALAAPPLVAATGAAGQFAWDEFFVGTIRNAYTRRSYLQAVRRFFAWCQNHGLELPRITPGMVGRYFDELKLSVPSKKLHLAAIRAFFDVLVQRHVVVLNPAYSVRTEKYATIEGRTPAITVEQSRSLLASIELNSVADFRDRALIAVLIYTAARAGAVAKLRLKDFVADGNQFVLRFSEKGGKARSIPVRHDLEVYLREYLAAGDLLGQLDDSPLFRSIGGHKAVLTSLGLTGVDVCRLVKRRLMAASLPECISPHSFRALAATDLLEQGIPLDSVQYLLGHADSRTTRLYDRRQRQVTRNIVERISV